MTEKRKTTPGQMMYDELQVNWWVVGGSIAFVVAVFALFLLPSFV